MEITQSRLKELLEYNPCTGDFIRIISTGSAKKGTIAGATLWNGYRRVHLDGKHYRLHRLAFLYMTGEIPVVCDHINRVRYDNRWSNLREATRTENFRNANLSKNNKTGYKGVSWSKKDGKFRARIMVNGYAKQLGMFSCKYEAFCEYVLASRKYFGGFSAV